MVQLVVNIHAIFYEWQYRQHSNFMKSPTMKWIMTSRPYKFIFPYSPYSPYSQPPHTLSTTSPHDLALSTSTYERLDFKKTPIITKAEIEDSEFDENKPSLIAYLNGLVTDQVQKDQNAAPKHQI